MISVARLISTMRHWFRDGVLRRIFKNAGLMLSGRATTGLLSLASLTLSARSLGVEQFGILVLVQTYGQVIATLSTLQSPQAVIRYGAISLQENDTPGLQHLLKYVTLLDVAGGVLGVIVGFLVAPFVGPYLGWSQDVVDYAQLYSFLVFFTVCATPTGILRLFDRFDLLAAQTTLIPFLRLVGIGLAVLLKAPLWAYLLAWFVAQMIGGGVLTYLGWRELYRHKKLSAFEFSMKPRGLPHPGLLHFIVTSNLYSSLLILTGHASTFAIGYLTGPAQAGLYKLARDLGTVLTKPAELLNQSIYAEFARLGSRNAWHEFTQLMRRGAAITAGAGAAMLMLVAIGGPLFLRTFFGHDFEDAYVPLVLLVFGGGLAIMSFPVDAALFALGRPEIPLRVSAVVVFAIQLPLLFLLTSAYGAAGAATAVVAGAAGTLGGMWIFTVVQLRRRTAQSPEPSPPQA